MDERRKMHEARKRQVEKAEQSRVRRSPRAPRRREGESASDYLERIDPDYDVRAAVEELSYFTAEKVDRVETEARQSGITEEVQDAIWGDSGNPEAEWESVCETVEDGDGEVLVVHNHVRPYLDPERQAEGYTDMSKVFHGLNGFRAFLGREDPDHYVVCDCGWYTDVLDVHYRVRGVGAPGKDDPPLDDKGEER